jgi:predicted GIY-YIG superfamily endonuclease
MEQVLVFIYVLECAEGKYYVGKTTNPEFRLDVHFDGHGSQWTKKYPPVQLLEIYKDCDPFDEDKYTKKMMMKHGINNVRGGAYVQIELPDETVRLLEKELLMVSDKCIKCGKHGHFVKDCTEAEKMPEDYEINFSQAKHIYYFLREIMSMYCKIKENKPFGKIVGKSFITAFRLNAIHITNSMFVKLNSDKKICEERVLVSMKRGKVDGKYKELLIQTEKAIQSEHIINIHIGAICGLIDNDIENDLMSFESIEHILIEISYYIRNNQKLEKLIMLP